MKYSIKEKQDIENERKVKQRREEYIGKLRSITWEWNRKKEDYVERTDFQLEMKLIEMTEKQRSTELWLRQIR